MPETPLIAVTGCDPISLEEYLQAHPESLGHVIAPASKGIE